MWREASRRRHTLLKVPDSAARWARQPELRRSVQTSGPRRSDPAGGQGGACDCLRGGVCVCVCVWVCVCVNVCVCVAECLFLSAWFSLWRLDDPVCVKKKRQPGQLVLNTTLPKSDPHLRLSLLLSAHFPASRKWMSCSSSSGWRPGCVSCRSYRPADTQEELTGIMSSL